MKDTERLSMPWSPFRTIVDPDTGIVATVKAGSYADYLDRVQAWLLQELEDAADAAERARIEAALEENRRERQELSEEQSKQHNGEGQHQSETRPT